VEPAELERRLAALERQAKDLRSAVMPAYWQAMDAVEAQRGPDRPLACPVCDRAARRGDLEALVDACVFGGGRLERFRCAGCGCIFGPAKVLEASEALLKADYTLLYEDYSEADSTASELRAFRSLRPVAGGAYLDWGCGRWSRTVPELRGQGYDVWGFEPSAPPEDSGFVVGDRASITGRFDGLFSNNVIEHMLRPVEEFRFFHRILGPGARMAHASPCYRYAYAFTRFHTLFLTGDSPGVLAERTGFRVVDREEEGEFINLVFERR
jgi:hypothetical protein